MTKERDSKKRSPKTRSEHDFYPTPEWVFLPMLEKARAWAHSHSAPLLRFCDPFAGDGRILVAAKEAGFEVCGSEIDASRATACSGLGVVQGDSLASFEQVTDSSVIFTNPPFSVGAEWVMRAAALVHNSVRHRLLVCLMRLAFLEGVSRAEFHRKYPAHVYVLPIRPSFTGKGTDSAAYAWFVWGDAKPGTYEHLVMSRSPRAKSQTSAGGTP